MKSCASLYKTISAVLMLSVCWNCSCGAKNGEEIAKRPPAPPSSSARLDPLDLPQDSRIIPKLQPHNGEIIGSAEVPVAAPDTIAENLIQQPINVRPQIDTLASQALRIQLHSTELFGDAKRERLIAEEVFDQPVFLDYEVPYYKVRVGSFSERKNAEVYLQKAKTAGYQNAWIVAVSVNVKEAQSLYENLPIPITDTLKGK